jgi:hypothetical protein
MAAAAKNNTAVRIVLPGDTVPTPPIPESGQAPPLRLGPGLRQVATDKEAEVVATKSGMLHEQKPASLWVDTKQKRVSYNCTCNTIVFHQVRA